jgi:serine/threonine protein kinase
MRLASRTSSVSLEETEIDPLHCSPSTVSGDIKILFSRDEDGFDICEFDFVTAVGQGSYGEVELWQHIPTETTYAVKSIDLKRLDEHEQAMVLQELRLLRSLSNPHLAVCLQAYGVDSVLILLLTYYRGGTLEDKIKQKAVIEEDDIARWLCQLLGVLRYLHGHNVIHRDICLENIFLSEDHADVVLGDLGACRIVETAGSCAKTPMGHLKYLSPEMLDGEEFTTKTDIWSLGVVLQRLLRVDQGGTSKLSGELLEIMSLMLQEDTQLRPSAASLCRLPLLDGFWPRDLCRNEPEIDEQLSDTLWRSALRLGTVKSMRD